MLKLYAWEDPFEKQILEMRGKEIRALQTAAYMDAGSAISWFMAPYLVSVRHISLEINQATRINPRHFPTIINIIN